MLALWLNTGGPSQHNTTKGRQRDPHDFIIKIATPWSLRPFSSQASVTFSRVIAHSVSSILFWRWKILCVNKLCKQQQIGCLWRLIGTHSIENIGSVNWGILRPAVDCDKQAVLTDFQKGGDSLFGMYVNRLLCQIGIYRFWENLLLLYRNIYERGPTKIIFWGISICQAKLRKKKRKINLIRSWFFVFFFN